MNKFKKFQDDLFILAKSDLYITDKIDAINKEIEVNSTNISIPKEHFENVSALFFENYFYKVKQNAKQKLEESPLNMDLIFYVWIDDKTGQLCYNFINSHHKNVPFNSEIQGMETLYEICDTFTRASQNGIFPTTEKIWVYQQILFKKRHFEFIPHESVGPVKFGMTMTEARQAVNMPFKAFQKNMDKYSPADAFDDSAMIIFYDKNDTVEAIEIYEEMQLRLNEVEMMGKPMNETVKWLKTISNKVKKTDTCYDIRSLGIMISGSDGSPRAKKVGYVFMYRKGYWDEYEAEFGKL